VSCILKVSSLQSSRIRNTPSTEEVAWYAELLPVGRRGIPSRKHIRSRNVWPHAHRSSLSEQFSAAGRLVAVQQRGRSKIVPTICSFQVSPAAPTTIAWLDPLSTFRAAGLALATAKMTPAKEPLLGESLSRCEGVKAEWPWPIGRRHNLGHLLRLIPIDNSMVPASS
jgi:hypothetical protein